MKRKKYYQNIDKLTILKCIAPLSAMCCMIVQSVSLFTPQWIITQELMSNPNYIKFNMSVDDEFLDKNTTSGLWWICQNEPGNETITCSAIEYFSSDDYVPDPNDSTGAIPYSAKRAAFFMTISTSLLLFGSLLVIREFIYLTKVTCYYMLTYIFCICWKVDTKSSTGKSSSSSASTSSFSMTGFKSSVLTFVSSITFILAGLMILASMVVYISTFKAEIGNKLRPKSSFQGPMFMYRYGYSFYFTLASLVLCEITGTLLIFLYIKLHQFEWKQKSLNCLESANYPNYANEETRSNIQVIYPVNNQSETLKCIYHSNPTTYHVHDVNHESNNEITHEFESECHETDETGHELPQIRTIAASVTYSESDQTESPVSPPVQFGHIPGHFGPSGMSGQNFLQLPSDTAGGQFTLHCRTHSKGRRYSRTRDVIASPGNISPMFPFLGTPRGSLTPRGSIVDASRRSSGTSQRSASIEIVTHNVPMLRRLDFRRQLSMHAEEEDDDDMIVPPPPPPPSIVIREYSTSFEEAENDSDADSDGVQSISVSESGVKKGGTFSCFSGSKKKKKRQTLQRKGRVASDGRMLQKMASEDSIRGSKIKKRKKRRSNRENDLIVRTTQV